MLVDHEPRTGLLNFSVSTIAALIIIVTGLSYYPEADTFLDYGADVEVAPVEARQSVDRETVINQSKVAVSPIATTENPLENKVRNYYEQLLSGDEAGAYGAFTEDALLSYQFDFGEFYGVQAYSFRANETYPGDETMFAGYEVLESEVASVTQNTDSLEVTAMFRQKYRWDGIQGEMVATEVFTFEELYGEFYVVEFRSSQKY